MRQPWIMLGVLVLARTAMGYAFQSVGSAGPAIAVALAVDFAFIGTLIGLFMLPGIALSLPSGLLARLASDRALIGSGLALMTLGCLVTAAATGPTLAATGRLVTGVGATLANLYFTKATLDWFAGSRQLPLAMALLLNSWPIGIALGLMTQGRLTLAFGWEAAILASAALALAASLLMAVVYREAPERTVPPVAGMAALRALSTVEWRGILLLAVVWAALNVGLVLVFGFAPALLTANGVDLATAGLVVGLGTWIGIAVIPLGGALAARTGTSAGLIAVCTAGTALVFALIAWQPQWLWAYVAFGLFAFAAAGPIMARPADVLTAANRAAGMGVFFTLYYAAMAALPALAGLLRDGFGPTAPMLTGAVVMLASLAAQAALARAPRPAVSPAP